jgi:hypothetical protein
MNSNPRRFYAFGAMGAIALIAAVSLGFPSLGCATHHDAVEATKNQEPTPAIVQATNKATSPATDIDLWFDPDMTPPVAIAQNDVPNVCLDCNGLNVYGVALPDTSGTKNSFVNKIPKSGYTAQVFDPNAKLPDPFGFHDYDRR